LDILSPSKKDRSIKQTFLDKFIISNEDEDEMEKEDIDTDDDEDKEYDDDLRDDCTNREITFVDALPMFMSVFRSGGIPYNLAYLTAALTP